MSAGNPALLETIRARIRADGPLSFAAFMEEALYHPEYGYYSTDRCSIGRAGDYFTNVSVGPIFGRLLTAQFAAMAEKLGPDDEFVIVEQGAHHGEFANDVLTALRQDWPRVWERLRYRIVEPFRALQDRQAATLAEFRERVEWRSGVEELEAFTGIYFCNELFDAFPVHLLVADKEQWLEKVVALTNDDLVFTSQPIVDEKLRQFVSRLPSRPAGYETEVNLVAPDLISVMARRLQRGYILAIDYGFSREAFYDEERSRGTLQCRSRHQLLDSPLAAVGEADITTHVEWTSLAERAEADGLRLVGFTDQHHFLTGILSGMTGFAENTSPKERRALQTLLHPEMLGRSFQVLALGRDVGEEGRLDGFKFARDPRRALGLEADLS